MLSQICVIKRSWYAG